MAQSDNPPNHPAHERAVLALMDAVEACQEFAKDHEECEDPGCPCWEASGLVTPLELFLSGLESSLVLFPEQVARIIAKLKASGRREVDIADWELVHANCAEERSAAADQPEAPATSPAPEPVGRPVVKTNPFYRS